MAHDFSPEWRIFFILSSGIFFLGREHATLQAPKASHAQRTPLNMGGLHASLTTTRTATQRGQLGKSTARASPSDSAPAPEASTPLLSCSSRRASLPFSRAVEDEARWQRASEVRLRRTDNGELALTRRKEARAGCLRMMAAFPCDLPLQQRDELTRHTSKCHTPVHEKKSQPQPLPSTLAIKKSRRNSAAKPCSG